MATEFAPSNEENAKRCVALVTGGTGAIGAAIALGLARHPNTEVHIIARDAAKAERTVERVRQASGNPHVHYHLCDLSLGQEIYALAETWRGPLHILINNAALSPRVRLESAEGIEMQFAVNVLAYYRMIQAFTPCLKASAPARVVNVASYWAGDLDLDDLEFKRRPYHNGTAYRQSKQANRMLTPAFAERLEPFGITVNACHPGDVNSKLSNDLGFGGHETPEQGAATPLWLAVSPEISGVTGRYFAHFREERCPFAEDRQAVEALFAACQAYDRQTHT